MALSYYLLTVLPVVIMYLGYVVAITLLCNFVVRSVLRNAKLGQLFFEYMLNRPGFMEYRALKLKEREKDK